MPKVKQINHVAVVVDDMDKALSFWRDALGMELHGLRDVPAEKSQVAFLPLPGSEVVIAQGARAAMADAIHLVFIIAFAAAALAMVTVFFTPRTELTEQHPEREPSPVSAD